LQKNIEKKEEQGKIMGRKIETTKDDRKALMLHFEQKNFT
jgi:hypothetical protein